MYSDMNQLLFCFALKGKTSRDPNPKAGDSHFSKSCSSTGKMTHIIWICSFFKVTNVFSILDLFWICILESLTVLIMNIRLTDFEQIFLKTV